MTGALAYVRVACFRLSVVGDDRRKTQAGDERDLLIHRA